MVHERVCLESKQRQREGNLHGADLCRLGCERNAGQWGLGSSCGAVSVKKKTSVEFSGTPANLRTPPVCWFRKKSHRERESAARSMRLVTLGVRRGDTHPPAPGCWDTARDRHNYFRKLLSLPAAVINSCVALRGKGRAARSSGWTAGLGRKARQVGVSLGLRVSVTWCRRLGGEDASPSHSPSPGFEPWNSKCWGGRLWTLLLMTLPGRLFSFKPALRVREVQSQCGSSPYWL